MMWHNLTRVLLMETTRLSTKGQIILPKGIRDSRAWGPGTEFSVEETEEGILLRPAAHFPEANLEEAAGCLRAKRKSKTPAQIRAAMGREVMRRHGRGRYYRISPPADWRRTHAGDRCANSLRKRANLDREN